MRFAAATSCCSLVGAWPSRTALPLGVTSRVAALALEAKANASTAEARTRRTTLDTRRRTLALARFAEELRQRGVRFARALELGHVPAVELEVARARKRIGDVAGEADRHERVLAAPHEQRRRAGLAPAGPETLVPRGRLNRGPPGRGATPPRPG